MPKARADLGNPGLFAVHRVPGFSTGWISLLIFSSITRIALAGENPVGMLMVTETAPTRWRATALGGLVGSYPLGYMLCSLAALVVVRSSTRVYS